MTTNSKVCYSINLIISFRLLSFYSVIDGSIAESRQELHENCMNPTRF